jgi:GcrA cell cycle regulator
MKRKPRLVSLAELQPHSCRFPFGDPQDNGSFGFCPKQKLNGGPYCPEHTAICFEPQERASGAVLAPAQLGRAEPLASAPAGYPPARTGGRSSSCDMVFGQNRTRANAYIFFGENRMLSIGAGAPEPPLWRAVCMGLTELCCGPGETPLLCDSEEGQDVVDFVAAHL